jgi:hypothetical protein
MNKSYSVSNHLYFNSLRYTNWYTYSIIYLISCYHKSFTKSKFFIASPIHNKNPGDHHSHITQNRFPYIRQLSTILLNFLSFLHFKQTYTWDRLYSSSLVSWVTRFLVASAHNDFSLAQAHDQVAFDLITDKPYWQTPFPLTLNF